MRKRQCNPDQHYWFYSAMRPRSAKRAQNSGKLSQLNMDCFSRIFKASPVATAISRMEDGLFLDVNDAWENMSGYTREEMVGHTALELGFYQGIQVRDEIKARLLEDGSIKGLIYQLALKSGEKAEVSVFAEVINAGEERYILTMIQDISGRKKAEDALRETELIFSAFLENSPVYVFFKDKNIRSLRLSRNYEQMLGMPLEDLLGKSMDELFPSDLAKSMVADDMRILQEGRLIKVEEELAGRIYETTKFPVYLDGKPELLAGFTLDITERKQAENGLKESEENYRTLIELSPDAIIVHRDGVILYANSAAANLYRINDKSELLGKPVLSFVHPDMRAMVAARIQKMVETLDKVPLIEEKFIRSDGTFVDVEVVANGIQFEGSPAVQVIAREITQRKQIMDSLKASEEKYRTLIETINTGIFMSTLKGQFIQVNPTMAQMAGYDTPEELLKIPARKLYSNAKNREELLDELLRNNVVRGLELEATRKDGSHFWVSISAILLKENDGSPIALLGSVVDISDRKRAEEAIQHSERRLRTLIENSADALTLLNADGSVIYEGPNVQNLTGYSAEERVGKSSLANIHPEDLPIVMSTLGRILQAPGKTSSAQFRSIRKDGSFWWTEGTATNLLHDPDVGAIVVNYRDITERKRAEEALKSSESEVRQLNAELEQRVAERTQQLELTNKELEAFAYSVSHDLRAPLRAIDGYSRVLMVNHASQLDAEGQELLEKMRAASQNMSHLMESLLGLSRMNRAEMKNENVDLSLMAVRIAERLQQEQPGRDVEWSIHQDIMAWGDARLLQVVMENLIDNAWKFSSKQQKTKIEFGCQRSPGETIYFVRDNGVGFNMQYAEKLFGAFQRLHTPTEFEGTGIGLATVQRIIHRHGGRVWADSEPGKGATFYFTLD